MNKLKKMALMVVGQSLAPDELAGGCYLLFLLFCGGSVVSLHHGNTPRQQQ